MRAPLLSGCFATLAAATAQSPAPLLQIEREVFVDGGRTHSLAWSPDGRWIASGGECGDVIVLGADTGETVRTFAASDQRIGCLAFSPDGGTLAVSGRDLSLWDTASWTLKQREDTKGWHVADLAWSTHGNRLACVSGRGRTVVLGARDLQGAVAGTRVGHTARVVWRDESPVIGVDDKGMLSGLGPARFTLPSVHGMCVSPDARLALIWNHERVVAHDADGERFAVDGGGPAAVRNDGTWVRAAVGELCFYVESELLRRVPLPRRLAPERGVLTADGRFGALHQTYGPLRVFDVATGAVMQTPADQRGVPIPYFAGPELVLWNDARAGRFGGTLSWWSIELLCAGKGPVRQVALDDICWAYGRGPTISRDGRFCGGAGSVTDLVAGQHSRWSLPVMADNLIPADGGELALQVFSLFQKPDGIRLFSRDGLVAELLIEGQTCASLSPDGSRVLYVNGEGVRFVNARTLEVEALVEGGCGAIEWVDDRRLLACGWGGQPTLDLLDTTGVSLSSVALADHGHSINLDRDSRRALVLLHDRVVIVRIAPAGH